MSFITSDGWLFTVTNVNFIIVEWYQRLLDIPRKQLLWFVSLLSLSFQRWATSGDNPLVFWREKFKGVKILTYS